MSFRKSVFSSARVHRLSLAIALGLGAVAAQAQSTITAPGMRAPGTITIDAEGVPVIQAANELDAAFLQGYAHARDRFFQMDFTRRGASGTAAELFGPAALASDVQTRTLGLRRAAQATWFAMNDTTRGWLKAYADGVNFWLATNPLPPEYGALELTSAAKWSPLDSLVIGKALAFQLSFDLDIAATLALDAYQTAGTAAGFNGPALFFEDVYRVQPPDTRVSIPGFLPGGAAGGASLQVKNDAASEPTVDADTAALARAYRDAVANNPLISPALRAREDRGASNWWLVAGSKTQSGKPILSNDPHLDMGTPSTFQEIHLIANDGLNVVGASVPGTPGVILGCNPRVCWGLTTNPLDVTDTYRENFILNTYGLPTHTLYKGNAEPVQIVFQSFFVNKLDGTPNNVERDPSIGYLNGAITVLVPRRNNGPVVQISGTSGLSVQYAGWGPTFELECFRQLNRASNLDQFKAAIGNFDVGSQNFAYADVDGNIAYFTSAEMPIRDDLQNLRAPDGLPPFLIRDGSGAKRNEWLPAATVYPNQNLPYEILGPTEMPFVVNPASGYIANANNDPVGTTIDNNALNQVRANGGLYYLNAGYSSYRMGRIDRSLQKLIADGTPITRDLMKQLQANQQPMDAELVLPFLLGAATNAAATNAWPELRALANDAKVAEAITRLRAWDYSTPTGIREGFDPGDNPASLPEPTQSEIDNSVAATLFMTWRGQAIRGTVDATLARVGLGQAVPDSDIAYAAMKNLLVNYGARRGVGASGLNFFQVTGAPNAEAARDYLLLKSLKDALTLLASESFAPAFNRSTDLSVYRWGRLHRIVFAHPLGGPFNLPDAAGTYGFRNLSAQLPGIPRPGGFENVDASGHNLRANTVNGFMFNHGPARRFIGEMTTPAVAEQILPGGESGVLGSPFYASQLSRWLTNRYKPLNIEVGVATANAGVVLSFVPRVQ